MNTEKMSIAVVLAAVFFLFLSFNGALAAEQTIRAKVPAITWASSADAVSSAARAISGVVFVDDDMMEQKLTIKFEDSKTSIDAIIEALKKAKYPVDGEPELIKGQ